MQSRGFLDRIIERSEAEQLSTRAPPELAGAGRDDEATARATWSPERASEQESERGGPRWFGRIELVHGLDPFGLTSGPRGILDFSKLV
jgi:hypothetical protein